MEKRKQIIIAVVIIVILLLVLGVVGVYMVMSPGEGMNKHAGDWNGNGVKPILGVFRDSEDLCRQEAVKFAGNAFAYKKDSRECWVYKDLPSNTPLIEAAGWKFVKV